jgi:methionyl aminopeptidase
MKIAIKSPAEIEKMRVVGRLAAEVLEIIEPHVKAGNTTLELNDLCHDYIVNVQKATPATLNYQGFPKSICTSVNHVVCHGIPDKVPLKNGDIINIDVTITKNGYFADASRMFTVGQPSAIAEKLIRVAKECLFLGIEEIRPGVRLGNIGATIQHHAEKHNFSIVREYCGHGIGKKFHEAPAVLHFGESNVGPLLLESMTFTIEPMLNAGTKDIQILKDGWTAVTKDRQLSAQWEHTILVTKNGYEILTLGT